MGGEDPSHHSVPGRAFLSTARSKGDHYLGGGERRCFPLHLVPFPVNSLIFANLRNFCPDFFASLPPTPERRSHHQAQLGSAVKTFFELMRERVHSNKLHSFAVICFIFIYTRAQREEASVVNHTPP